MAVRMLLDPGGTRLKFACVQGGEVQSVDHVQWHELAATGDKKWTPPAPWSDGAFADVHMLKRSTPPNAPENWLATFLSAFGMNAMECRTLDPLARSGLEIAYTHGKPGSDRIAAALACHRKNPKGQFVIIDAGTCITIDLLDANRWKGGAIMPGIQLQAASMRQAGLPEIRPDAAMLWNVPTGPVGALGKSTEEAIRAGIPWAVRHAVKAVAEALMTFAPKARVILTGGDAQHFEGLGGWQTFADPNLVMRGGALLLNESTS